MDRHRILIDFLLPGLLVAMLIAAIAEGQQNDPAIHRAVTNKLLFGEGRLKNGTLKVRFRQWEKFETYSVTANIVDSSTATNPDSLRFLTIKNIGRDGFTIRSPRFATDTVAVIWQVVGR